MSMRVATFAMNDRMLAASLKTQARMAEMQMQQATGQIATDLGGYGAVSRSLINLEISLARSQTYATSSKEAGNRVEVMYSTMDTVNDVLSSFRSALVAIKSTDAGDETRSALSNTAKLNIEELATLLNTQYEGRYLFGGSATTIAPVDLSAYAMTDPDTADTSYYQGNSTLAAVQVSSEQSISYGVSANDGAFEKAFRAFSIISSANGTLWDETVNAALDLIVEAIDGAAGVQGSLSVNAATLERAQTREEDYQAHLSASLSDVRDADVTELAVKLTAYEVQLQAAYATLAKIQGLNLLDYLR
ncbi:MAG: flagellin [Hyphomicrobiales bacterium]|nr:MAG: flagellin [Hyphomicrobiales bacterium]